MATIDATKIVSKEQFDAKVSALFQKTTRLATPAEDTQKLADLLGVSTATIGETAVGFPKGGETCGSCGRAFTFLDVAETGLKAHSKEFLVDAITGKNGHIVNQGSQPFNCHSCGAKFIGGEYIYVSWGYVCA